MPALEGRVLVVDQSPADRKLMTHNLSGTALILKMVSSSGAAIDAVQKHDYDLILCDLHLENDAVRMIQQIRANDYKGPIIVVTAESSASRLTEARAAGANEIIGKPHSAAYLASLLAEWLDVPGVDRPIYSNLEETAGMAELVADFVDDVHKKTHFVEKVIESADMAAAREVCVELVGSGTGFGFASVTEAARDALTAIDTAQNKQDAKSSLKRLVFICERVRCGSSARPMGGGWKQSA
jgi:CheY-like chemotaxis protein